MADNNTKEKLLDAWRSICSEIEQLPTDEKIEMINSMREKLHEISPFRDEPVDCVIWVKSDKVQGNDYNPNAVAPPEMKLLSISIQEDGYTQPIVVFPNSAGESHFTVVDGYHRTRVGKEVPAVRKRVKGYLPVTCIRSSQYDIKDRIAATIRHNRARGVHGVEPMIDIVAKLALDGWSDEMIAKNLGMDCDEILRFKQHTGLPEIFKDAEFSRAWEAEGD